MSNEWGILKVDADILALATINAARILKWDKLPGSIEDGKSAELMVMKGITGDPNANFLNRSEAAISLVVTNGIPRYGHVNLMNKWTAETENFKVSYTKYKV